MGFNLLDKFRYFILSFCLVMVSGFAFAQQQHPWDFLRPLTVFAESLDNITRVIVFILTLALLVISFLAYNRMKTKRLLIVFLAFLFFAVKWALKVIDLFFSPGYFLSDASENVFELIILVLLFGALFYKRR